MGKYRGDDKRGELRNLGPEDGMILEGSLIFFFYESSGFDFEGIWRAGVSRMFSGVLQLYGHLRNAFCIACEEGSLKKLLSWKFRDRDDVFL